jgi:hypothetical protein
MNRNDEEYLVEASEVGKCCDEECSRDEAEMCRRDNAFLAELQMLGYGGGTERKVEIGRRYFIIDRHLAPALIRIRAFTVTGNGSTQDRWEGMVAFDRKDLMEEQWMRASAEEWDEAVRLMVAGKWTAKMELPEGDLFDTPEKARDAGVRRIDEERDRLGRALKDLRSEERALLKMDSVLCLDGTASST